MIGIEALLRAQRLDERTFADLMANPTDRARLQAALLLLATT
jgi:hypothetical protein